MSTVTATFWAVPSILVRVPHQSEKAPTLSARTMLCLAASSIFRGLPEERAGLASDFRPSRKASCAGLRSSQGLSKQPARARDEPLRRIIRRETIMVFRTARIERDRHLVLADLAVEMLQQLLEGERGAGLQLDEDLGRFLAMRMGDADDDAFVDRRMLVDRLLDHARVDVVARRDDQVLGAVDQVEPAIGVHVAHVDGAQALPVAGGMAEQDLVGLLRLLPVALHDLRADDADLADVFLAGRQDGVALLHVADLDHRAGHRHAARAETPHALVDRADRAGGRGLGEAVALDQGGAGQLLEGLLHLDRQGRTAPSMIPDSA